MRVQILAEVAIYEHPTAQQPGMYTLKAAALDEFDPFFWVRNNKDAEVGCSRLAGIYGTGAELSPMCCRR